MREVSEGPGGTNRAAQGAREGTRDGRAGQTGLHRARGTTGPTKGALQRTPGRAAGREARATDRGAAAAMCVWCVMAAEERV